MYRINKHARPSRDAIILIGDSNTSLTYFVTAGTPEKRWGEKLQASIGRRVVNWGTDGAQTEDFLGRGSHALTPQLSKWRYVYAHAALVMLGLNETGLGTAVFEQDTRELVSRLLGIGTTPILVTNVAVDYPDHYSTNRNVTIDQYDDVYRNLAAELGLHLIDVNAAVKAEIAVGTWDHRIRADGVTFDNSLDATQPEPWASDGDPASWYTNIHLNDAGATLYANQISAYLTANFL